jgi:hypothetical protein
VKNAIGSINKHSVIVTSAPNTNMPTLMAQQNTTKKHRNESDIEANLIIAKKHKKITSTVFLLTRESCMLMFVRMGEKQKANTPQTQTQQQQTQRSGQQQDATQVLAKRQRCVNVQIGMGLDHILVVTCQRTSGPKRDVGGWHLQQR